MEIVRIRQTLGKMDIRLVISPTVARAYYDAHRVTRAYGATGAHAQSTYNKLACWESVYFERHM